MRPVWLRPLTSALRLLGQFLIFAGLAVFRADAASPALDLQTGDTMVFAGDSITHQSLYTQYIETYFATRFPERRIRFHNAGVAGDRAADLLDRFDEDVAAFKPKYVTVLLGMNDGQYQDFNPDLFATYASDMNRLLDRIKGLGAVAILMSPTMFDFPVVEWRQDDPTYRFRGQPRSPHYNGVMAYYGAWGRDQASALGIPYVNVWGPLNDLTSQQRAIDSRFTLLSDAIHPGPGGHCIIATSMIETLRPERRSVSAINLTRSGGQWQAAARLRLQNLSGGSSHVTFTFTAAALPWVLPAEGSSTTNKWGWAEDGRRGFELSKAGHRLSNEVLRITGLEPGDYEIRIDGRSIGKPVSHVTLAARLELQTNENTPQYQQALQVALLNRERNDHAVRPSREVWAKIKAARKRFEAEPERFVAFMVTTRPEIERLQRMALGFEDRIHAAAQPKPRHYEITRVPAP